MKETIQILLIILSVFSLYIKYLEMINVEEEEYFSFKIGHLNLKLSKNKILGTFNKTIFNIFNLLNCFLYFFYPYQNITFKFIFIILYDLLSLFIVYLCLNKNFIASLILLFHFSYLCLFDFFDFLKLFFKNGTIQFVNLKNLFFDFYINEEARITLKFLFNLILTILTIIILRVNYFFGKYFPSFNLNRKINLEIINNNFAKSGEAPLKWE